MKMLSVIKSDNQIMDNFNNNAKRFANSLGTNSETDFNIHIVDELFNNDLILERRLRLSILCVHFIENNSN